MYASVLEAADDAVGEPLAASADPVLVHDALEAELSQVLQHLLARVCVVEFHHFRQRRGLPVDTTSTSAFDAFVNGFDADTVTDWFDTYPVLGRLVRTVLSRRVVELDRVARAARVELANGTLVGPGLLDGPDDVIRIRGLGSDPHNGGRIVCRVDLASGASLVYKPRSLAVDQAVRGVLGEVAEASGVDIARCTPRSLDCGTHGWQEYLRPEPLAGRRAAGDYFTRLGTLAAVLGVVGSVDMQHENILACGDVPVLFDLETFLHLENAVAEVHLTGGMKAMLKRSVFNTMLLPQRIPVGPYSVLVAGIGVPVEQHSEREDFVVVNDRTDAVDIARRRFRSRHTHNVPVGVDGERYSAIECADEFMEGYRRGHAACIEREAALRLILAEPVPVRHVLRSTAIYHRVLSAATHPDYLRDESEFRRILSLLGPPSGFEDRAAAEFVAAEEVKAMASGDYPYFWGMSDDIRVRGRNGTSPVVADVSPRARAEQGLADARTTCATTWRYLVEIGLDELGGAAGRRPALSMRTFDDVVIADGMSWRAVAQRLRSLAIHTNGGSGAQVGWLSAGHGPTMGTIDTGSGTSLHDAGGIEVFFARIDEMVPEEADPAFTTAVQRGVDWLELCFRDTLETNVASVISGPASLAYVRTATERRSPALEAVCRRALDEDEAGPADLLAGLPGFGLLLSGYPETADDLLERLLEVTIEALDGPRQPERGPWNLAHGEVGVVWALHRLANRLGDLTQADHARDRFVAILERAAPMATGWCGGAAGLLMIGCDLLPANPCDEERLVHLASRAVSLDEERPVDISVCHGVGGVVQSLVQCSRVRRASWALDMAEDHLRRVAAKVARHGYETGTPTRTNLPGYFLGWSGLADSVLLCELERAEQLSWVPLALASTTSGLVAAP